MADEYTLLQASEDCSPENIVVTVTSITSSFGRHPSDHNLTNSDLEEVKALWCGAKVSLASTANGISRSKENLYDNKAALQKNFINYKPDFVLEISKRENPEKLLKEFSHAESEMKKFLRQSTEELLSNWENVSFVRKTLDEVCVRILVAGITFCRESNIDCRIWTCGYYQSISMLRKSLSKVNNLQKHLLKGCITFLIDEGKIFFKELLAMLDTLYNMSVSKEIEENHWSKKRLPEGKHHGLNLMYNVLIYIGDLYRYQETIGSLKKAHEYYEKARQLFPNRGRAYSQLAIIAFRREDDISKVYNIMRAMTCKHPVDGCRMQLLEFFDAAYKKHKLKQRCYWCHRGKFIDRYMQVRKEIWVHPLVEKSGWKPTNFHIPQTKEEHLAELNPEDIYTNFTVCYIWLWGIFFTKIGVESINTAAEETLVYFQAYLKNGSTIPFLRLIQLFAINIFVMKSLKSEIRGCQPKPKDKKYELLTYLETAAESFFLEMMSLVVEELNMQCCLLDWDSRKMQAYSAYVMLCAKWFKIHPDILRKPRSRPPFCIRRIEFRARENEENLENDVWIVFGELMDSLASVFLYHQDFLFPSVKKKEDEEHQRKVKLPEYTTIAGFELMMGVDSSYFATKIFYANEWKSMFRAQNFIRLLSIYTFGKFDLVKNGLLDYVTDDSGLSLFLPKAQFCPAKNDEEKCGLDTRHVMYWSKSWYEAKQPKRPTEEKCNTLPRPTDNCGARIILRNKKRCSSSTPMDILPKILPEMATYEHFTILKQKKMQVEVVVSPKNIIIDTNTFISKLYYISLLMQLFTEPLLVPLSVILELKGLSKGGFTTKDRKIYKDENSPGAKEKLAFNKSTAELCNEALKFIDIFLGRHFVIISCYGRLMTEVRSVFDKLHDDYYDKSINNDARILDAGFFLEANNKKLRDRDIPHRVFREAIVLTEDRMMRIFGHDKDLPSGNVKGVLIWAYASLKALKDGKMTKL